MSFHRCLLQRRRRGPPEHLDAGVTRSVQPHRRVADRGRGRGRRTRGAPKAPESRRNIGMHGEVCPVGLREPIPLGAKRFCRAGATGTIEGRSDGRVTDRGCSCSCTLFRALAYRELTGRAIIVIVMVIVQAVRQTGTRPRPSFRRTETGQGPGTLKASHTES